MTDIEFKIRGTAAPQVTDDSSLGYDFGSVWKWSNNSYHCTDATVGAAVWQWENARHPTPSQTYFGPEYIAGTSATQPNANQLILEPVLIRETTSMDEMGISLTVLGSTGSLVRVGIFEYAANGYPITMRKDWGAIALDTSTGWKGLAGSHTLPPGAYCFAAVFNSVTTMPTVTRISSALMSAVKGTGTADVTGGNAYRYYSSAFTYAALTSLGSNPSPQNSTDGVVIRARKA